ncbi:hypothetical protein QJS66_12115 [Kocuria rhizophila]|nr:hypothetical protein QJS66_12115 [Kocuria rhizophila]
MAIWRHGTDPATPRSRGRDRGPRALHEQLLRDDFSFVLDEGTWPDKLVAVDGVSWEKTWPRGSSERSTFSRRWMARSWANRP